MRDVVLYLEAHEDDKWGDWDMVVELPGTPRVGEQIHATVHHDFRDRQAEFVVSGVIWTPDKPAFVVARRTAWLD